MRRALLLILLTTACGTRTPSVTLFGDSITTTASSAIARALSHYELKSFVKVGEPKQVLLPLVQRRMQRHRPHAVVLELGTDEVLSGHSDWRSVFDEFAAAVEPVRCVIWVTVSPYTDYFVWRKGGKVGKLHSIAAEWNAQINAAVAKHPNFHVVDWAGAVASHPSFVSDGLHPTSAGNEWLAVQYREMLDGCIA